MLTNAHSDATAAVAASRGWRIAAPLMACSAILGISGAGDFLLPPSSATASRLPFGQAQSVSTVKGALDGTVTATASQPSNPPSLAIDGDASTAWCIASWPDTLTVDLGQLGPLDGAGISLERIAANRWYSGLCLRFDQAGLGEQ